MYLAVTPASIRRRDDENGYRVYGDVMRRVAAISVLLLVCSCGGGAAHDVEVTAWTASRAVADLPSITAQLDADPGIDPIQPQPAAAPRVLAALAGTDLVFVEVDALPPPQDREPRKCIVVLSGGRVVDHFCQFDAEYLPHQSPIGFLLLPVYDEGVTVVRLTICDQREIERPFNGFVVFPITAAQVSAPFAAEMLRNGHRLSVEGDPAALHRRPCAP